jgi:hypothetical protein
MTRGRIGEPIVMHVLGKGGLPLEFFWRGRRHRVRQLLGLPSEGGYRLRTTSGLCCLISKRPGHWQMDRLA